jgi:flagellar basal-body rod protein FlgF
MDRMLYVSMTGAKQIMLAQAVNNHNLANVSTTGFRADRHAFSSLPIYGEGFATRVNAVARDAGTDFSAGTITTTGKPLDIAVQTQGFLAVQGKDGKEAYTRAGSLQVSATGILETISGLPVLADGGTVTIPPSNQITIGADGTVSVVPLGLSPTAASQVGRIKLVNPEETSLQKGEDGLFRSKDGVAAPADAAVRVMAGAIESSNVNMAESLVSMIELQRLYEMQIKAMNTADQNAQAAQRLMLAA